MYSEFVNEYITDVQYFEGFVGAFGTILSFIFFRRVLKLKNMSVVVGLSFLMTWILRKLLMNLYVKLRNDSENKYNVNIMNNEMKGVNLYILFIILITSALVYNVALKKISYVSKLVYVFFIAFFYFFVKQ
jgi:hypothetical protein